MSGCGARILPASVLLYIQYATSNQQDMVCRDLRLELRSPANSTLLDVLLTSDHHHLTKSNLDFGADVAPIRICLITLQPQQGWLGR